MNTQVIEYIYDLSAALLCVSVYVLSIVFLVTWVLNKLFDNNCVVMKTINAAKKWAYTILFSVAIISLIGVVFALLTLPV